MPRALITGGAGFIGSHLAEALLGQGWEVQIVDDLSTGSMENVEHLKDHPRFSYVLNTVLNRPLMLELVDRADAVFHLAAAVGVRLIVERSVYTIETNIKATELVLELCAKKGKPVLITSTSEVYGKLDRPRFAEDDDLVLCPTSRFRWCYAASKIIDEFLAKAYGEVFNVGHEKEISIYELAVMVREMAESPSEIVFVPYEEAYEPGFEDMPRRLPDLSKIRELIGYRPTLDLPAMLERIIAYERERMQAKVIE